MKTRELQRLLRKLSPENRATAIQQIEPMLRRMIEADPDREPHGLVELSPIDWHILLEEYQKAKLPMDRMHVAAYDPMSYLDGIQYREILFGMKAWVTNQGWCCKVVPELAIQYARRVLAAWGTGVAA